VEICPKFVDGNVFKKIFVEIYFITSIPEARNNRNIFSAKVGLLVRPMSSAGLQPNRAAGQSIPKKLQGVFLPTTNARNRYLSSTFFCRIYNNNTF
jgi:hypothetical protein